jgi:transposase InsO family protein
LTYFLERAVSTMIRDLGSDYWTADGARGRQDRGVDARVSAEYVERHIEIGIEALRLIRRHGRSVRHLRFDE